MTTNSDCPEIDSMWQNSCFLTRLVAHSVRVSEAAGGIIKSTMSGGDLKIINKSNTGGQDLQTEADRSAQYLIENSLQRKFGNRLKIIGEEDVTSKVPLSELGVSKEVLEIDAKCSEELRNIKEEDVVIWVDPLDGTSEFAQAAKTKSPLLKQVTVLIGITHNGKAIAGVIHQPYFSDEGRTIWGIKGVGSFGVHDTRDDTERIVVTTRSHSTQLVQDALDALETKHLLTRLDRVGGAGFKVIRCLEDAAAYVFASGGCKKWDTAAPEAILTAAGGKLTDISGRSLYYGADAQKKNTGGVLATAAWINHEEYLNAIPEAVKNSLPEKDPKSQDSK
ncbi:inositol monophosphatase family domain-containing protein [Ditylenchus destructor]|nr:inositol monophosphatase family domain-containing protein [Ditylenchus destructor]